MKERKNPPIQVVTKMNKMQCMTICASLIQNYPKLRPVILAATGSTYGKEKIKPLFFTGEAIGTFEILKTTF